MENDSFSNAIKAYRILLKILLALNIVIVTVGFVSELLIVLFDFFVSPVSSLIYEFIGFPSFLERIINSTLLVFIPSMLFLMIYVLFKKIVSSKLKTKLLNNDDNLSLKQFINKVKRFAFVDIIISLIYIVIIIILTLFI